MRSILAAIFLLSSICMAGQEIKENILENQTYIDRTAYFKEHPLQQGQIIFLGNSITQAGKWEEYFPIQKPANRGISGDNTEGMLARLDEIIEAKPKKLFIMAGINDISLNRPNKKIMANVKEIIARVKQETPQTAIYIQSVLPTNTEIIKYSRLKKKEKQIEKLNKDLRKLAKKENLIFIDIYPSFLAKKHKMDVRYTADGLHINEEGYSIWVNQIRNYVEEN